MHCMVANFFGSNRQCLFLGFSNSKKALDFCRHYKQDCAHMSYGLHSTRFSQGQVSLAFKLASVNKDPV